MIFVEDLLNVKHVVCTPVLRICDLDSKREICGMMGLAEMGVEEDSENYKNIFTKCAYRLSIFFYV